MATIRVSRIFDGERLHREGGVVVTTEGRITDVRLGDHPDTARLIDGTLLPGLIDCHVRLCADAGPAALDRLPDTAADELTSTIETSLRRHLQAGVTTVRDLGDIRNAVLSRRPLLPNVIASGTPLTTPGGHCWFSAVRSAARTRFARRCVNGCPRARIS